MLKTSTKPSRKSSLNGMSSYQLLKILDLKMYIPHIEKMGKFRHIQHNIQANLQYSKEKILIFHVHHLCDWGKLSIFHFESGAFAGNNRASKLGIQEKFPVDPYHTPNSIASSWHHIWHNDLIQVAFSQILHDTMSVASLMCLSTH